MQLACLTTENGGWVADVLRLLVVARHGLSVRELLDCLTQHLGYHGDTRVTHYDVMMLLDVMHGALLCESTDGLLMFRHQHLKESVEHTLLSK